MPLVVVVSDCTDVAFSEMRGVIWQAAGAAPVRIEPLVPVHRFSVVNAAFVVKLVADAYPPGTIISVVVNALRERTERIVGRLATKDIVFEGTNTGQFGWLVEAYGVRESFELTDPGFVPFGGKYVHAPAVGRIAANVPLSTLGSPFGAAGIRTTEVHDGQIVHIDNFGNAKFRWNCSRWRFGDRIRVDVAGTTIEAVYWRRMMERADGEWVVYPGSSFGLTELGEVRRSGLLDLSVEPGDRITLTNSSSARGNSRSGVSSTRSNIRPEPL